MKCWMGPSCPQCGDIEEEREKEMRDKIAGAPSINYKYIVMRHPDDCQNWQNLVKTQHATIGLAEDEAKRLSVQHMNTRFCVGVIYEHFITFATTKQVSHEPNLPD